ncbi:MAG: DUF6782 family putative metallopeptidase [Micavibrio sp.]
MFQRFAKPSLRGYSHPSLTDAFNKMAQSPIGQKAMDYCKSLSYPLYVTDEMEDGTLGTCSPERIEVRPNSTYGTLAHEMRHAFQMHAQKTHAGDSGNPILEHMKVRMTEADAFTFSCLVKMARWKELGFTAETNLPATEKDTYAIERLAFKVYATKNFHPQILLEVLRQVFNYYYLSIAEAAEEKDSYEKSGMQAAERSYRNFDAMLNPSWETRALRLFYKKEQDADLQNRLKQYRNTSELIDDFAKKLGQIPGIEGNYLTDTRGAKLSSPAYIGVLSEKAAAFHQEWHQKIMDSMARRGLKPA